MFAYRQPAKQAAAPAKELIVARDLEPQYVGEQLRGRDAVVFAKAEWCPHCREFDPQFREMARDWPFSSAIVTVERQHGDSQQGPASKFRRTYRISSWPTLLLIGGDGQWKRYEGPRQAEQIRAAAEEFFQQ